MAAWRQDLTYAFRRLSRLPGFVLAVVASIGLGIAANSTIFSMVSRFVLRPPPVGDPSTLMTMYTTHQGECCNNFSWPLFSDVREQSKSFAGVAAYFPLVPASIGGEGDPERAWGQAVTSNFFDVALVGMALGRGFLSGEEHLPVMVLGYRLWQRRFGGDPAIAGKTVTLSGRPFTVVGVAPPSFRGLELPLDSQFWVPLGNFGELMPEIGSRDSRSNGWLTVVARLKNGVARAQGAAELEVLARRLARAYPAVEKNRGFH